jgi:putative ABC transport system permease protein
MTLASLMMNIDFPSESAQNLRERMFRYHIGLAFRAMRRSVLLTLLMIAAIGVGVGSAMSVFAVLRGLSGDPIPSKSQRLYGVWIDNWGPQNPHDTRDQLSYLDAMALMRANRGARQSAMYAVALYVTPTAADLMPFEVAGRAVYADFFKMFEAPFRAGAPWSVQDEENKTNAVVLGAKLAARLFPNSHAVGQIIVLNQRDYRIVGVLAPWHFQPRIYDLTPGYFQETEDVFLPLPTAVDQNMYTNGSMFCPGPDPASWSAILHSECRWLQFWTELPTPAPDNYRQFLAAYLDEQTRLGRFHWPAKLRLLNSREWVTAQNMVPSEIRLSTLVGFSFLLVCLVNACGLMLAKLAGRAGELSVRRAMGASKMNIFAQCITEAAVIGIGGGLLGLLLAILGISIERGILREDYAQLVRVDAGTVLITLGLAIVSAICVGLYPAWGAVRAPPAWQLKSQ